MAKELTISLELKNPRLTKPLKELLSQIANIDVRESSTSLADKSGLDAQNVPDILIIDSHSETVDILSRVRTIKREFPKTAIFVVSDIKDPKQIIDIMKAGASEYLVEPVDIKILLDAIEEIRAHLTDEGRIAQGNIYSFISAKGGVGSTVLAVNTAAALASSKKSAVALVDMSFQSGDSSVLLDVVPQSTILDITQNMARLDVSFLRGNMTSHNSGINFLSAPINPEDSEDIHGTQIKEILALTKKLYDHVILDCPSMNVNDCSIEAFKQSEKVLVVTDMSVPSIRNANRLCKLLRKFDISLNKIEVIVNRYIKGGALSLGEIEKNFDKPVFWLVPNDFSSIVSSINRGVPLVKLTPNTPFSKNVDQLSMKLRGLLEDKNFRGLKGKFGKSL